MAFRKRDTEKKIEVMQAHSATLGIQAKNIDEIFTKEVKEALTLYCNKQFGKGEHTYNVQVTRETGKDKAVIITIKESPNLP